MDLVIHVIATVGIQNVNVICVSPGDRPWIDEPERVAAVLEAPAIVFTSVHVETVPAAKTGRVMGVRNAAMLGTPSVFGHSLWLLRVFLGSSRITLLRVILIRRMCLWLLRMRGLLCALLLSRLWILRLLVRHGLSLMLLLLRLRRPVFPLCGFSLLLLPVLFLASFLACVH